MADSYATVLEEICTLSEDREGNRKRVRRVRWRYGAPKIDIRTWIEDGSKDGRPGKGVTLDLEEAAALRDALTHYLQGKQQGEQQSEQT